MDFVWDWDWEDVQALSKCGDRGWKGLVGSRRRPRLCDLDFAPSEGCWSECQGSLFCLRECWRGRWKCGWMGEKRISFWVINLFHRMRYIIFHWILRLFNSEWEKGKWENTFYDFISAWRMFWMATPWWLRQSECSKKRDQLKERKWEVDISFWTGFCLPPSHCLWYLIMYVSISGCKLFFNGLCEEKMNEI